MSRTRAHVPYRVLLEREGHVEHDHRNGRCVIGEPGAYRGRGWHPRAACDRWTRWKATCLHKASRPGEAYLLGEWVPASSGCDEALTTYLRVVSDGMRPRRWEHEVSWWKYDPDVPCAFCDTPSEERPTCFYVPPADGTDYKLFTRKRSVRAFRRVAWKAERAAERRAMDDAKYGGDVWEAYTSDVRASIHNRIW